MAGEILGLLLAAGAGYLSGTVQKNFLKKQKQDADAFQLLTKNLVAGDPNAIQFANTPEGQKFVKRVGGKDMAGILAQFAGAGSVNTSDPAAQIQQDFRAITHAPISIQDAGAGNPVVDLPTEVAPQVRQDLQGRTRLPTAAERLSRTERLFAENPAAGAMLSPPSAQAALMKRGVEREERAEKQSLRKGEADIARVNQTILQSQQEIEQSLQAMNESRERILGMQDERAAAPAIRKMEMEYKRAQMVHMSAQNRLIQAQIEASKAKPLKSPNDPEETAALGRLQTSLGKLAKISDAIAGGKSEKSLPTEVSSYNTELLQHLSFLQRNYPDTFLSQAPGVLEQLVALDPKGNLIPIGEMMKDPDLDKKFNKYKGVPKGALQFYDQMQKAAQPKAGEVRINTGDAAFQQWKESLKGKK